MRVLHEGIKTFKKSRKSLQKLSSCDLIELLHQFENRTDQFSSYSYNTDMAYNPLLQILFLDKEPEARELNGELTTLVKEIIMYSSWNWRLLRKLPKVKRSDFYMTLSDLLKRI